MKGFLREETALFRQEKLFEALSGHIAGGKRRFPSPCKKAPPEFQITMMPEDTPPTRGSRSGFPVF